MNKKGILFLLVGLLGSAYFLPTYIISAVQSFYNDGFGISISYGNKIALFWSLFFLCFIVIGIVNFVQTRKKHSCDSFNLYALSFLSFCGSLYYLSLTTKSLFKHVLARDYLTIFILFLVCLCLFLWKFIQTRKKI